VIFLSLIIFYKDTIIGLLEEIIRVEPTEDNLRWTVRTPISYFWESCFNVCFPKR